jgi:hypothetical protein
MNAPISRVLPTPVASAKHSEGTRAQSPPASGIPPSAWQGWPPHWSWPSSSGAASMARTSFARDSACGGRRDSRPVTAFWTRAFILRSPRTDRLAPRSWRRISWFCVAAPAAARLFNRLCLLRHRQVGDVEAVVVVAPLTAGQHHLRNLLQRQVRPALGCLGCCDAVEGRAAHEQALVAAHFIGQCLQVARRTGSGW